MKIKAAAGDAENTQNAVVGKRGRKQGNKVKQEIKEEDNAQEPSTSNGVVAEQVKRRRKASKKDIKEENQKDPSPGKTPGGAKSKSNASKKKKGSSASSKGKENIDTNNAPVKSVVKSGGVHIKKNFMDSKAKW